MQKAEITEKSVAATAGAHLHLTNTPIKSESTTELVGNSSENRFSIAISALFLKKREKTSLEFIWRSTFCYKFWKFYLFKNCFILRLELN